MVDTSCHVCSLPCGGCGPLRGSCVPTKHLLVDSGMAVVATLIYYISLPRPTTRQCCDCKGEGGRWERGREAGEGEGGGRGGGRRERGREAGEGEGGGRGGGRRERGSVHVEITVTVCAKPDHVIQQL